jgi:hypothetical protein
MLPTPMKKIWGKEVIDQMVKRGKKIKGKQVRSSGTFGKGKKLGSLTRVGQKVQAQGFQHGQRLGKTISAVLDGLGHHPLGAVVQVIVFDEAV